MIIAPTERTKGAKGTEGTPLLKGRKRTSRPWYMKMSPGKTEDADPRDLPEFSRQDSNDYYTVDDALDAIGLGTPHILILGCMSLAMISVFSQVLLKTTIADDMQCEFDLTDNQEAFVSTIFFIGEIVSTYPVGKFIDKYGRKTGIILLSAYLFLYGFLFCLTPENYAWVIVLRFLAGFFACGVQSSVYCYTGEMAPARYRTPFMLFLLFSVGTGALYISTMGFLVLSYFGWRGQALCASLPVIIVLFTAAYIPESPRYSALRGNLGNAMTTLTDLAARTGEELPDGYLLQGNREIHVISANFLHLLTRGTVRQTICVWMLGFTTYFCYYGLALSTSHLIEMYESGQANNTMIGQDSDDVINTDAVGGVCESEFDFDGCSMSTSFDAYVQTLIASIGDIMASPVALLLVVLTGRRFSMALALCLDAMIILCLMFTFLFIQPTPFLLIGRCLSLATFGIIFLYTVEAYPTFTRALAIGTLQMFAKLAGALTPYVADSYLLINPNMGIAIYAGVCFIGGVSAMLLPLETAGRQLQ